MQAVARKIVHWISGNRVGLSRLMGFKSDTALREAAENAVVLPSTCTIRHDLDLLD
jgi:hypothetical protein